MLADGHQYLKPGSSLKVPKPTRLKKRGRDPTTIRAGDLQDDRLDSIMTGLSEPVVIHHLVCGFAIANGPGRLTFSREHR